VNLANRRSVYVSTAASSPLSTGGTPLGLVGDDEYYRNYHLPFVLSSFNSGQGLVSIQPMVLSTSPVIRLRTIPRFVQQAPVLLT